MAEPTQASALATSSITAAAATVLAPIVVAYAKSKGIDLSTPEQQAAAGFVSAVMVGAFANHLIAAFDAVVSGVVAVCNAVTNRLTQALNKLGGTQ